MNTLDEWWRYFVSVDRHRSGVGVEGIVERTVEHILNDNNLIPAGVIAKSNEVDWLRPCVTSNRYNYAHLLHRSNVRKSVISLCHFRGEIKLSQKSIQPCIRSRREAWIMGNVSLLPLNVNVEQ